MEKWDACGPVPIDEAKLTGQRCVAGLDLSSTTDITALVLVFPVDDKSGKQGELTSSEGNLIVLPFFWIPVEGARQRERRDRVPYLTWAREGLIEMTPGNVVDYDVIRKRINELSERFDIEEIALDRWNATHLATQLSGDGFEMVAFGQGYRDMTAPTKEMEKLVLCGRLQHGGHPVLRWMASNVAVETDAAGNLKPSKKKSIERIDGIVAAIMALGRAMLVPQFRSVYETRGPIIFSAPL
jgi:phage terminase large subunit-like protein